jgi:L-ascorbate metabolism protein UlaG (beta-lactamase superfamily)
MDRSPQWAKGRFHNAQALWTDYGGALLSFLRRDPDSVPRTPVPVVYPAGTDLASASRKGLRATWLGHSTVYLEVDGVRILTDPVWSERASPLRWLGPKRFFKPVIALEDLPVPQVVVISHDHYDHLDRATVRRIRHWPARFIVPLGVGGHLADWGVPRERITELDWWETARVEDLEVTCTPARHASGRWLFDKDKTLWGGFAFIGPRHRVYFSGDTGMFAGFREIGGRLGPFDLTMIEAGAYDRTWPDWHLGPEQAVRAHALVRGGTLLPLHWGLFDLAAHGWTEPIERVLAAARTAGAGVCTPRPGESFEPGLPAASTPWWPALPWKTALEAPIRSTLDVPGRNLDPAQD